MPVFIDDSRVELAGDDLADVLEAARRHLQPHRRVVVEVELDGQRVPPDELEDAAQQPVAGAEVRLTSADPRELVTQTLEQVQGRLEEARQIHEAAAAQLQADEAEQAMAELGRAIEIWIQTQQSVLHASMLLGLDLQSLRVGEKPFEELTSELLGRLQSLKAHLTSRDTVALADELAYEWPGTIDQWHELIGLLLTRVEQ